MTNVTGCNNLQWSELTLSSSIIHLILIGEDVYDDEREVESKSSTRKSVKGKMTSAQAAKDVINKGSSL